MSVSGMLLRRLRQWQRRVNAKAKPQPVQPTPVDWAALSPAQAFSHVYKWRFWGGESGFYSGSGSHDPAIVSPYVEAVGRWARGQPTMDAVDLGCGDFDVGRQLRPLFGRYVACDVVPELIAHHRSGPDAETVDFRCIDISLDPLPEGDVVFIRQVLQHLPNAMIQQLIPGLQAYRWLVLTEHLPATADFVPNLDKPIGPETRLDRDASGVDLCAPPFDLRPLETRVLCEVPEYGGLIRTTLYRLQA